MAGLILILLLIFISFSTAKRFKVLLVEAMPVVSTGFVLILYVLSFFNQLDLAFIFAGAIATTELVLLVKKQGVTGLAREISKEFTMPCNVMALLFLVIVGIATSGKVVNWWDEYNFWATDAKSIFFLNGFADKYCNVAQEFGDYPPALQLMKWIFLQFSRNEFHEGLMFSGFYCLSFVYILPLFKYIDFSNKRSVLSKLLTGALSIVLMWLLPSCVEVFYLDGCCADFTLALLFGAVLVALFDCKAPFCENNMCDATCNKVSGLASGAVFDRLRICLYLSIMPLTKNVGIIIAVYAIVFIAIFKIFVQNPKIKLSKWDLTYIICPAITQASWGAFCLINRRISKNSGTAVSMVTGKMGVPDYKSELLKTYIEAFFVGSIHRWRTIAFDLSPFVLFVLLTVLLYLVYKINFINALKIKKQFVIVSASVILLGFSYYVIILITHLTVFAMEEQYLQVYAMSSSMTRYCAPFNLGFLIMVMSLLLQSCSQSKKAKVVQDCTQKGIVQTTIEKMLALQIPCALIILLLADYNSAYRGLVGYRNSVNDILSERAEIVGERSLPLLEAISVELGNQSARVLYIKDQQNLSWVGNTYLNYEASPISLAHAIVDPDTFDYEALRRMLEETHSGYFYIDELSKKVEWMEKQGIAENMLYKYTD